MEYVYFDRTKVKMMSKSKMMTQKKENASFDKHGKIEENKKHLRVCALLSFMFDYRLYAD